MDCILLNTELYFKMYHTCPKPNFYSSCILQLYAHICTHNLLKAAALHLQSQAFHVIL